MSDSEPNDPSSSPTPPESASRTREPETDSTEDKQLIVAEMIIGTVMIFVGFLTVLLSISSGFEISVIPLILYFVGLAIWAHARVENVTVRYTVITLCFVAAAGFFQYGEVHFWHKQVIFWGTILMTVFFMFSTAKTKLRQ